MDLALGTNSHFDHHTISSSPSYLDCRRSPGFYRNQSRFERFVYERRVGWEVRDLTMRWWACCYREKGIENSCAVIGRAGHDLKVVSG